MTGANRFTALRPTLLLALALSALYGTLVSVMGLERGLTRSILIDARTTENRSFRRIVQYIGSESFDKERRDLNLPQGRTFEWTGFWYVPASDTYQISVGADNQAALTLDGRPIVEHGITRGDNAAATQIALNRGPHKITIAYEEHGTGSLELSWASNGSGPRPFGQADLYPSVHVLRAYQWLAPLKWAALFSWLLVAIGVLSRRPRVPWRSTTPTKLLVRVLLAGVLVYAALLRFDALVSRWGFVPGSATALAVQSRLAEISRHLRPEALGWPRSAYSPGGDPYAYLQQAREQTNFYSANLREPVYPFSIKLFLHALGQADIAVCVTSAVFSWLTIVATYFLGSYVFSSWVGLGAAFALAIDQGIIGSGISGNRDDAFAFFVVFVAYVTLWAHRRPTAARSLVWGLAAGAACLTRITALSFVLPVLAYRVWTEPKPTRVKSAAVSVAGLLLVVAPFLINCWIQFGSPFYSVTGLVAPWDFAHGAGPRPMGWSQHLLTQILGSPAGFLDTLSFGTIRAFQDRWMGFDAWPIPGVGPLLATCAFAGLLGFCWSSEGRFLLLVLATSPVQFLLSWETLSTAAQNRYTLHLYPFFLIAAALAAERSVAGLGAWLRERPPAWPISRSVVQKSCLTIVLAAAAWIVVTVLPYPRMMEDLKRDGQTAVVAGPRDFLFFRQGWADPVTIGNITARESRKGRATVQVPLIAGHDATLTVRLNPVIVDDVRPQIVRLTLNGTVVSTFALRWDPEYFGSYTVDVPQQIVKNGLNRLDIAAAFSTLVESANQGAGGSVDRPVIFTSQSLERRRAPFRMWYALVSVKPAA